MEKKQAGATKSATTKTKKTAGDARKTKSESTGSKKNK